MGRAPGTLMGRAPDPLWNFRRSLEYGPYKKTHFYKTGRFPDGFSCAIRFLKNTICINRLYFYKVRAFAFRGGRNRGIMGRFGRKARYALAFSNFSMKSTSFSTPSTGMAL